MHFRRKPPKSESFSEASISEAIKQPRDGGHGGEYITLLGTVIAFLGLTALRIVVEAQPLHPGSSDFNGEEAQRILRSLCMGGPRVTGSSHAERDTVAFLMEELHSTATLAKAAGATLEVETQHGSGAFYTDFMEGFTCAYQNVSSVVARLSWPRSERDALLIGPQSPAPSQHLSTCVAPIHPCPCSTHIRFHPRRPLRFVSHLPWIL